MWDKTWFISDALRRKAEELWGPESRYVYYDRTQMDLRKATLEIVLERGQEARDRGTGAVAGSRRVPEVGSDGVSAEAGFSGDGANGQSLRVQVADMDPLFHVPQGASPLGEGGVRRGGGSILGDGTWVNFQRRTTAGAEEPTVLLRGGPSASPPLLLVERWLFLGSLVCTPGGLSAAMLHNPEP